MSAQSLRTAALVVALTIVLLALPVSAWAGAAIPAETPQTSEEVEQVDEDTSAPPATGKATRGVAVDVGRIDVQDPLRPGQAYTLPIIGVRNPGAVTSMYVMGVQTIDSDRLHPAEEWFRFSPATLQLEPGERQTTEIIMTVPHSAENGDYEALIAAQIATDDEGATVGAAAASRLTFTVEGAPVPLEVPGWLVPVTTAAVLLALLGWFARRFSFSIERRA